MLHTRKWADDFEEGIKAYGFSTDQIHRHKDADQDTMVYAIWEGPNSAMYKIRQNASQGCRTLLLCFYAGHGANKNSETHALLNSNIRGNIPGGNQYYLENDLG